MWWMVSRRPKAKGTTRGAPNGYSLLLLGNMSRRTGAELAADRHLGLIYFVSFIPHHLCGGSAKGCFIRTLRDIAVPANHFFASFDSNGPLRAFRIPGDFHLFYSHDNLQSLLCIIAPTITTNCSSTFLDACKCIVILFLGAAL